MPLKHHPDDATTFELAATTNLPYERNLDERYRDPESIQCYDFIFIGNLLVALRTKNSTEDFEAFGMTVSHRHSSDVILPRSSIARRPPALRRGPGQ